MTYTLNDAQKNQLLTLARETLESYVSTGQPGPQRTDDPLLLQPAAAFVTLNKDHQLRGCIGHVEPHLPLWDCVRQMAIAASTHDPRFTPVTQDEVASIQVEISVLTPLEPLENPEDVHVGTDGLVLERGGYRGLLLPQVPLEWGWDRETFLAHTARKAGLPPDAWKDPKTKLFRFQALVFQEDPR